MYKIEVDGKLLFSSALNDDQHIILSPKLSLGVNEAGSLSFVLPPGNVLHGGIKKIKSIITVYQDDEIIFRGRAMDDEKDFYNQKDVYCEGDRSFLLDSQCAPYTYSGTVKGLLQKLIDEHNEQVDDEKKFILGEVSAVDDSTTMKDVENVAYWETLRELDDKLLSAYGGYIRTRMDGDACYIDWLKQSGGTNSQVIEFSVNLLDLKETVNAADVFTILIPLGASEIGDDGEYTEPVSIKSVNNGKAYIQDDEAVALYGKIWRTKTWDYEYSPKKLLEKGREYLKTGIAVQTLTLKAVDMHFIDSNASAIRVGDYVRILSNPHGLDITMNCTKIEIDLLNPENTTYTFGEPPRTLTENVVKTEEDVGTVTGSSRGGGGGRSVKAELKDYIRWADIRQDKDEGLIEMLTGQASKLGEDLSQAIIRIDGANHQITLLTQHAETTDERMTEAEALIKVNAYGIEQRVSKDGVISAINQSAESITISASKINLEGYVHADNLAAQIAKIASVTVTGLNVVGSMRFDGMSCKWSNVELVDSVRIPALSGYNVRLGDGGTAMLYAFNSDGRTCSISRKDPVSFMKAST